jgi:organic radical activating enzyme
VGQRQIFVRFIGCDMACRYCDTRLGNISTCRAQLSGDSVSYEELPATMPADQLTVLCGRLLVPGPSRPTISLTGGEPLLHREFLRDWLPAVKKFFSVYLETNGIHDQALLTLGELIDVISMDFKLPSATGLRPFWEEHGRFLAASKGRTLFAKVVVTADTAERDVLRAARILADFDNAAPFVIQPATGMLAPGPDLIIRLQNAALGLLADVRVIPQVHPLLKLP